MFKYIRAALLYEKQHVVDTTSYVISERFKLIETVVHQEHGFHKLVKPQGANVQNSNPRWLLAWCYCSSLLG